MTGESASELWKNTGSFFYDTLNIPETELTEDSVENVRRVSSGRRKQARVHDEVVVFLRDVETRDLIYSYAPNLSAHQGKAGIRMEIPCHLLGKFKCLSRYGRNKKEETGRDFKWSIKFEDINQSLAIDVKYPDAPKWQRVSAEEILANATTDQRNRLGSANSQTSGSGEDPIDVEMIEERGGAGFTLPLSTTLQKFKKRPTEWGQSKK